MAYNVVLPATFVLSFFTNFSSYKILDSSGTDVSQWFQIEDATSGWGDVKLHGWNYYPPSPVTTTTSNPYAGARTQYYDHSTKVLWNSLSSDRTIGYATNGWGGTLEPRAIYIKKCLDTSKVSPGTFKLVWSGEVQTNDSGYMWKRNFNIEQQINFDFSEQDITPGAIVKGEAVSGFYNDYWIAYDVFATPKKIYVRMSSAYYGNRVPRQSASNSNYGIGGVVVIKWRTTNWPKGDRGRGRDERMILNAFGDSVYGFNSFNIPTDVGDIAVKFDVDSYFKNPAEIYFHRQVGPTLPPEPSCAGIWDSATGVTVWNNVAYSAYTYGTVSSLTQAIYSETYKQSTITINDNSTVENIDSSLLMNVLEGLFDAQSSMKGFKYYLLTGIKTATTFKIYATNTLVLIRYFEYTHTNNSIAPQRIVAFGFCGTSETGPRLPGIIFSNTISTPPSGQPVLTPGSGSTQTPTTIQSTTSNAGVSAQSNSYIYRLITFT